MTSMTSRVTGIQRVVRNIVRHGRAAGRELDIECVPVRFVGGCFRFAGPLACQPAAAGVFKLGSATKLRTPAETKPRRSINKCVRALTPKISDASSAVVGAGAPVAWGPGDILLLADSSWEHPLWFAVAQAQAAGATVGTIQYDLIPILNRDLVPPPLTAIFSRWMQKAIRHSDFFVTISESVRHQLKAYAAIGTAAPARCGDRIVSFPLGSDIDAGRRRRVRGSVRVPFERCDGGGTYIVVGTIESRKNQELAVQAFELLWGRSCTASLVLIGRAGAHSTQLCDHVRGHERFGEHLFMYENMSDGELQWCYRHARALIFPSKAEGYGLPIVEAMQHGLPVFASDIAVHCEVGGSHCRFFDPSNPYELARLLADFEAEPQRERLPAPPTQGLPRWSDSVRELITICMDCSEDATRYELSRAA
jgi:glycosyltransferase involved in cell wall biosynthesis